MRPLRILVVDDDHDCADSLTTLLRLWGHDAVATYSARQALTTAGRVMPDVALLDVSMPLCNGYRLADSLRRLPGGRGLALVAVTGHSQPSDFTRSRDQGFAA